MQLSAEEQLEERATQLAARQRAARLALLDAQAHELKSLPPTAQVYCCSSLAGGAGVWVLDAGGAAAVTARVERERKRIVQPDFV